MLGNLFSKFSNKSNKSSIQNAHFKGNKIFLVCNLKLDNKFQPQADEFTIICGDKDIAVQSAFIQSYIHEDASSIVLSTDETWTQNASIKLAYHPITNQQMRSVENPDIQINAYEADYEITEHPSQSIDIKRFDLAETEEYAIDTVVEQATTHAKAQMEIDAAQEYEQGEPQAIEEKPQGLTAESLAKATGVSAIVNDALDMPASQDNEQKSDEPIEFKLADADLVSEQEGQISQTDLTEVSSNTTEEIAASAPQELSTQELSLADSAQDSPAEHQGLAQAIDAQEALVKSAAAELGELDFSEFEQEMSIDPVEQLQSASEDAVPLAHELDSLDKQVGVTHQDAAVPAAQETLSINQDSVVMDEAVQVESELTVESTEEHASLDLPELDTVETTAQIKTSLSEQGVNNNELVAEQGDIDLNLEMLDESKVQNTEQSAKQESASDNVAAEDSQEQLGSVDLIESVDVPLSLSCENDRIVVHGIKDLNWRSQPQIEDFNITLAGDRIDASSVFVTKKSLTDGAILVFHLVEILPANARVAVDYRALHNSLRDKDHEVIKPFSLEVVTGNDIEHAGTSVVSAELAAAPVELDTAALSLEEPETTHTLTADLSIVAAELEPASNDDEVLDEPANTQQLDGLGSIEVSQAEPLIEQTIDELSLEELVVESVSAVNETAQTVQVDQPIVVVDSLESDMEVVSLEDAAMTIETEVVEASVEDLELEVQASPDLAVANIALEGEQKVDSQEEIKALQESLNVLAYDDVNTVQAVEQITVVSELEESDSALSVEAIELNQTVENQADYSLEESAGSDDAIQDALPTAQPQSMVEPSAPVDEASVGGIVFPQPSSKKIDVESDEEQIEEVEVNEAIELPDTPGSLNSDVFNAPEDEDIPEYNSRKKSKLFSKFALIIFPLLLIAAGGYYYLKIKGLV